VQSKNSNLNLLNILLLNTSTIFRQRAFTSTWTSIELNKARSLNYDIQILEVYHFGQRRKIFEKFVKLLCLHRALYSGFPEEVQTEEDKIDFCRKMNKKLMCNNQIPLDPEGIEIDKEKKAAYKEAICGFFGKFGQKNYKQNVTFLRSPKQLIHRAFVKREVEDIGECSDLIIEVVTSKNTKISNPRGNMIYWAFIATIGRDILYKAIENL